MLAFAFSGILIILALGVICFAAYKIKAESFEFSTAILKLISFSIKITSPHNHPRDSQGESGDET